MFDEYLSRGKFYLMSSCNTKQPLFDRAFAMLSFTERKSRYWFEFHYAPIQIITKITV